MPLFLNLVLVLLLISSAGLGGYLLARAHFTATIANRVLAYQARLARAQRESKQALVDVARLAEDRDILIRDLERARDRVQRYELALFDDAAATPTAACEDEIPAQTEAATAPQMVDQPLQELANAYLQRVGAFDNFDRVGDSDVETEEMRRHHGAQMVSRAIA